MSRRNGFLLTVCFAMVTIGVLVVRTKPKPVDQPDNVAPAQVETSREIIKQFQRGGDYPKTAGISKPVVPRIGPQHDSEATQPTNRMPRRGWEWYDTNVLHSVPKTNTITFGSKEITFVTKYGVNTNAVLEHLRQMTDQDSYVEARLAELAAIAAGFQKGMKQPEVVALIGEEPTRMATNQSGIWVLYSPHPLRQEPDLGNQFKVFRLLFDPHGGLEKWWFSTRN